MVIIWRGLGWLVPVIVFGFSLIANLAFDAAYGETFWNSHHWPFALSLFSSAAVCWFLGNYLKARSDRVVIDKETGKEMVINQSRHALFFIPMHLWGALLAVWALIELLVEFARR